MYFSKHVNELKDAFLYLPLLQHMTNTHVPITSNTNDNTHAASLAVVAHGQ